MQPKILHPTILAALTKLHGGQVVVLVNATDEEPRTELARVGATANEPIDLDSRPVGVQRATADLLAVQSELDGSLEMIRQWTKQLDRIADTGAQEALKLAGESA